MNRKKLKVGVFFLAMVLAASAIHYVIEVLISMYASSAHELPGILLFIMIYINTYVLAYNSYRISINGGLISDRYISVLAFYNMFYVMIMSSAVLVSFLADELSNFFGPDTLRQIEIWLWMYSGPGAFIHLIMDSFHNGSVRSMVVDIPISAAIGLLATMLTSLLLWRIGRNKWYLKALRHALAFILWTFFNIFFLFAVNF